MALRPLTRVQVIQPISGSGFNTDDVVSIYWDDSAEQIVMERNGSPFNPSSNTYLGEYLSNYIITWPVSSYEDGYAVSSYSFCDGANLVWFRMLLDYATPPYMAKQITANSPVCDTGGGAVCDIHWVGAPQIVHAENRTDGGSITTIAQGSNGQVRYHLLKNIPYSQMTNTTGTFTGLVPGNYVVYAKDPMDCTLVRSFTILYKPTEVEHYRFTWKSAIGTPRDSRVRIYEREYTGSLVELTSAGGQPFVLNKRKQGSTNDKFAPIHPTHAILTLMSEQDYQFLPLYTLDNKKYRVVYEVDEGAGFTPVWQGFIEPQTYLENFTATPYPVEFGITDNVVTLRDTPFADDDGHSLSGNMKLIKVIALILKKTGLSLKIRSGINIFETNHDTDPGDDPLDQTYIDVACYRDGDGVPFTCWEVLEHILRPFGARLYQYGNQWMIEEIERATAPYNYRIFDADGDYESNGTFDPIMDIKAPSESDRVALAFRDHTMEVIPAYGRISITSRLNYTGSIVTGGFEKEDLLSPESEVSVGETAVLRSEEGFRDWTLRLNGTTGVSFGRAVIIERDNPVYRLSRRGRESGSDGAQQSLQRVRFETKNTRSVGAFYYLPGESWSGNLRDAYVESAAKPYQYGPGDVLKLQFEHSTPVNVDNPFMVLRIVVKLGNQYLQQDLTWDTTEAIYRAYPTKAGTMQKFDLTVQTPDTTSRVDTTIQVRIYFYAMQFYDFGLPPTGSSPSTGVDGLSAFKAMPTASIDVDYQTEVRVHDTTNGVNNYFRAFYELYSNGEVQPDDYDSITNPKKWRLLKVRTENNTSPNQRTRGAANTFYIDNVTLDALPGGQPPPEEETIQLNISKYVTESLDLELYHFDLPDIVNGKNMYNNYFRLSDGTPTAKWARLGAAESLPLQYLLLKILGGQHSAPTFKMRGSFLSEFARIGLNSYLRLTKPASAISLSNTTFDSDLNGWSNVIGDLGDAHWLWSSNNSGCAAVNLIGNTSSTRLVQSVNHGGGFVSISAQIKATGSSGNTREDVLWVVFFRGNSIIHTEKLRTFLAVSGEDSDAITHTAYIPGSVDRIGFYIQNVNGSGSITYEMGEFTPSGNDIKEVYQITDYSMNEQDNLYTLELMQISQAYISLDGIDTGETTQSGGVVRQHSQAYSSAYA